MIYWDQFADHFWNTHSQYFQGWWILEFHTYRKPSTVNTFYLDTVYIQTFSKIGTLVGKKCWSFRRSWSIACRRYSNHNFIFDSTPGFNELGRDNIKKRRETFTCCDLGASYTKGLTVIHQLHAKPYTHGRNYFEINHIEHKDYWHWSFLIYNRNKGCKSLFNQMHFCPNVECTNSYKIKSCKIFHNKAVAGAKGRQYFG